jgi:Ca2+-binding EF-hand superfamily protein
MMMKTIALFSSVLAISVAISSALLLPACAADRSEKAKELEQRFRAADKNKDGVLTEAEAKSGMPKLSKHFGRIDADKSRTISLSEIKTAIANRSQR